MDNQIEDMFLEVKREYFSRWDAANQWKISDEPISRKMLVGFQGVCNLETKTIYLPNPQDVDAIYLKCLLTLIVDGKIESKFIRGEYYYRLKLKK
jgi:hypothetical protein